MKWPLALLMALAGMGTANAKTFEDKFWDCVRSDQGAVLVLVEPPKSVFDNLPKNMTADKAWNHFYDAVSTKAIHHCRSKTQYWGKFSEKDVFMLDVWMSAMLTGIAAHHAFIKKQTKLADQGGKAR